MPQFGGHIRFPSPGERRDGSKTPRCPECGTLLRREGAKWWCVPCDEFVKPR